MINIILPIAGEAKRFVDRGYDLPKPLIPVNGVPMIKLALSSLITPNDHDYKLIFVVRSEHCVTHRIDESLRLLFSNYKVEIVQVPHLTKGTLCSCLAAESIIDLSEPLVIYTPDVYFHKFNIRTDFIRSDYDGFLVTFKANSQDHSYVAMHDGIALQTAEKVVISGDALVGVYCFRSGQMFIDYAKKAITANVLVNNEFYVAPMYNLLIKDGLRIGSQRVDKMYVLGTPNDLDFYESHVAKYQNRPSFAICCDHSGFELKVDLLKLLTRLGIHYTDFGSYSLSDSDHYDSLKPCINHIGNTGCFGIGICCTGQGFNIAANKAVGIRSALIHDAHTAEMSRRHNAANFFCLAARSVTSADLPEIIGAIVNNSFDGGRHATRISKFSHDPLFIG